MRRLLIINATAALLAACGGADPANPDAGPTLDAGSDDYHVDRVGYVNVIEGGAFLSVFAAVADGPERPLPAAIAADGDCAVYRRPAPALCQPACDGVCEAPGVCRPWAQAVDVGTITVTGLKQPLAFVRGGFGYEPTPAPGTADLFDAGDPIAITAPGAAIGGFDVALTGVADLTGTTQTLTLTDGQPAEVTWAAAGSGRVQLALLVGWHGAPWEAMLLCETADDGALTIPGALVTALPHASSGLESHTSTITRFTRKSVLAPAGVIEFVVGSQRPIYFTR
ncbi:MAG: hypothetical protein IPH80_08290 [Myxococcales bacterium]|nr:hypothetical protein [Myxococcales bacterium]